MPQRGKSLVAQQENKHTDAPAGQHVGCSIIIVLPRWGIRIYLIILLQGFCRAAAFCLFCLLNLFNLFNFFNLL
jgi:hypothetical protein